MIEKEKIKLSSVEATAYWWVNILKHKVREIAIKGALNQNEVKFAEIFYNNTEFTWRKLYLELIKYINQDVNNYVSLSIDSFSQDTNMQGHDRLNVELSNIMGCFIPDIGLASNNSKDSVIYTNRFIARVWYKSGSITDLQTKYEPDYVLTGDTEHLNFYNLLISTIAVLNELDKNFKSIPLLRERFCEEYKKNKISEESIKQIIEMFNYNFNKACDKGIILGRYWKDTYFCSFHDIDFIGLEQYMDTAEEFANAILQKKDQKNMIKTKNNAKKDD